MEVGTVDHTPRMSPWMRSSRTGRTPSFDTARAVMTSSPYQCQKWWYFLRDIV
jgi:hypothetical protein